MTVKADLPAQGDAGAPAETEAPVSRATDGAVAWDAGVAEALDALKWDTAGLMPAIAQDHATGRVLMVAWMNRESLAETIRTRRAVYWSRSRGRLWRKGEESGNWQKVFEIRTDCDRDVILLSIEQQGGVACHTGRESCFFRRLDDEGNWQTVDAVKIDPASLYAGNT